MTAPAPAKYSDSGGSGSEPCLHVMPVFFFEFQNVDICLGASEGPLSQHIVQQAANQPGTVLNFSSKLFCIIAVCGSNRNKFSVADPAAVGGSGQPLFVRRGGGGGYL